MLLRLFLASRPQFLTASLVPVLVAGAYVKWLGTNPPLDLWLLTLLGMALLQAAANLLNDYFDHMSMADDVNRDFVRPFSGGARMIQQGSVSPHEVLFAGLLCLAVGSGLGLYLAMTRGLMILLLGLFGVVTLFFYTAPPLSLGYRGLGEIFIFLDFGVLPMLGTEYVLTQQFTVRMLVLSLPVGLMIAALLWVNQFPDADADAMVGKRHLVVILGRPGAARALCWMYGVAFTLVAVLVSVLWLPWYALVALVAALPAGVAMQRLTDRPEDPAAWKEACPAGVIAHFLFGLLLFLALMVGPPMPAVA